MPRRSQTADPADLQKSLVDLLEQLPQRLRDGSVGEQVGELVRAHHLLRDLGASIGASLAPDESDSGQARMVAYLRAQVGRIVHTDELMIVAGIADYARRIREIRTDLGWPLISGMAVRDMRADAFSVSGQAGSLPSAMAADEYLLIEDRQDKDAPRRWALAGELQKTQANAIDKIGIFLTRSVGHRVTAEELRYVAGNSAEWTASVRELHQRGWRISARMLGAGEIPIGICVLTSRP